MERTIIDLINLCFEASSFFVSLVLLTMLSIVFATSIKKNANILYWIFGVMAVLYSLPMLLRACGLDLSFSVSSIPVINVIFSEFSSAAYFIHPLIIIIMYMGALSLKTPHVAKLMSIRKELSIIVGFAVIAHATKRILYTFPRSWDYFVNHNEYMAEREVASVLGTTISNFVLFLGIFMTVLFLLLWITSFDSVRRKMGMVKWKKVQKWSYVLYAMLFIHSAGLQAGSLINSYARERIERIELVEQAKIAQEAKSASAMINSNKSAGDKSTVATTDTSKKTVEPKVERSRPKRFYLGDVEVSRKFRSYLNISLYILIYGSYLYLRIRKAKRKKLKRASERS